MTTNILLLPLKPKMYKSLKFGVIIEALLTVLIIISVTIGFTDCIITLSQSMILFISKKNNILPLLLQGIRCFKSSSNSKLSVPYCKGVQTEIGSPTNLSKIFTILAKKPIKPVSFMQVLDNKIDFFDNKQRHSPASTNEWNNSVYSYNKDDMRSIKGLDLIISRLIKIYFSSIPLFVRKKMRQLKRHLLTNRVYISKPELKHTSSKILITLYFFAETAEKKKKKYLPWYYRIKQEHRHKNKLNYFNVDYLLKNIDKKHYKSMIYNVWELQLSLFKTKIESYWLEGILEKDKLQFFQTNHEYLKDWFKNSLVYYNDIVNSIFKIIKVFMLRYKLKIQGFKFINKLKLRYMISKIINNLIYNYPKSNINNRLIFFILILRLIWSLHLKSENQINIKNLVRIINKLKKEKFYSFNKNIDLVDKYINRERKKPFLNLFFLINLQKQKKHLHKKKEKLEKLEKLNLLNPEIILYINNILKFKIEKGISKKKFILYLYTLISKSSLLISFNYLVKYNFKKIYLEKLDWLTQIGRDRLYPNTQVIMDYIKKKDSEFFLLLKKYYLKNNDIIFKINQMQNILLTWINRYSKKKIEINLIRLKHMYLNSDMIAEYIATKLITKKRSIYKVKRKLFNSINLVYYNKYDKKKLNFPKFKLIKKSLLNKLSNISLNNFYIRNITYENILNIFKYKFISGIRLVVAGRLTRRNVAARSIKRLTWIGSLKNIDSSYKAISVANLRGHFKPNSNYSFICELAKTGAFGVKTWTSYYGIICLLFLYKLKVISSYYVFKTKFFKNLKKIINNMNKNKLVSIYGDNEIPQFLCSDLTYIMILFILTKSQFLFLLLLSPWWIIFKYYISYIVTCRSQSIKPSFSIFISKSFHDFEIFFKIFLKRLITIIKKWIKSRIIKIVLNYVFEIFTPYIQTFIVYIPIPPVTYLIFIFKSLKNCCFNLISYKPTIPNMQLAVNLLPAAALPLCYSPYPTDVLVDWAQARYLKDRIEEKLLDVNPSEINGVKYEPVTIFNEKEKAVLNTPLTNIGKDNYKLKNNILNKVIPEKKGPFSTNLSDLISELRDKLLNIDKTLQEKITEAHNITHYDPEKVDKITRLKNARLIMWDEYYRQNEKLAKIKEQLIINSNLVESQNVSQAGPSGTQNVSQAGPSVTQNVSQAGPSGTQNVSQAGPSGTQNISSSTPVRTDKGKAKADEYFITSQIQRESGSSISDIFNNRRDM